MFVVDNGLMLKGLAIFAVYPLALINLAAGFLVVVGSRTVLLIFLEWLYRDGRITDGREINIPFIIKSIDNLFIVITVLGLLGLFVVLEYQYTRWAYRGLLLQRFIRFLGIQLLTLGVVHLAIDLMLGNTVASAFSSALTVGEILAGAAFFAVTFLRPSRPQHEGMVGP